MERKGGDSVGPQGDRRVGSGGAAPVPRCGGARVDAVDLTRRFGSNTALDRLTLTVEPGETLGLLGANGAGKTTFIRLITGFLIPSAGSVTVDGFSPVTRSEAVHARLGYVAETSRLYPDLRVERFLRFAGAVHGLHGAVLDEAIERSLDRFTLRAVRRRLVGNLSKGFQQRVSLAQAFLHDPALLIVDEPTSGLDPLQQAEVDEVLAGLRGERTVILCTHDLAEARALATRVAVLRQGRLVATGPADEVLGGGDPLALFRAPGTAA
jgi:ABC-2 type transport system ATP-binding protein